MTRKDHKLIAEAIRKAPAPAVAKVEIVFRLANALQQDNPRFDRISFIRACGEDVAVRFGLVPDVAERRETNGLST